VSQTATGSGNNRITRDGYSVAFEVQNYFALAVNRKQFCGVQGVQMFDPIVDCIFALRKNFRQDDTRAQPILSPIKPEVTHDAAQKTNVLVALTRLRTVSIHSWRGNECRIQMDQL
jgi:hypothetical protein